MKFQRFLLLFIILCNIMMSTAEVLDVKKDEKKGTWGYVNEKDKWVIKPKYIDVTDFFYPYKNAPEKIAFVTSEPGKVQIINTSGDVLVEFESIESDMRNFRDRIEKNSLYDNPYMFTKIPIGNGLYKLLGINKDEYDIFEWAFEEIYPLIESHNNLTYKYNQSFLKKNNGKIDYISFEIDPKAIYDKKILNKRRIKIEKEEYGQFNNRYLKEIYFSEVAPGIIFADRYNYGDFVERGIIYLGKFSGWNEPNDYQNYIQIFKFPDLPYSLVLFDSQLIPLLNSYIYEGNVDRRWIAGVTPDNKFIFGIKSEHGQSEKLLDIEVEGDYEVIHPNITTDYNNIIVKQKNGDDFFMVNLDKGAIIDPFKTTAEADAILSQSREKDYIKALKLYLDVADLLKSFPQITNNVYNSIVENIFKECNDKAAIIKTVKSYEPSEFLSTTIYRYNTWGPGFLFPNKFGSNDLYSLDGKLLVSGDQYDSFVYMNSYNNNLFIFKKNGKYGAFNLKGEQVIAPTHTEFGNDNSYLKRFLFRDRLEDGSDKYFVYDDKGNLLASEIFTNPNSKSTEKRILNFLSTWM